MTLTALTGVTGRVGSRVATLLAPTGLPLRLLARDPSRVATFGADLPVVASSYDEPAGLDGIDVLFMVSAAEHVDRIGQHARFLTAAAKAGVRHVVYTSFLAAAPDSTFTLGRHHWATEQHARSLGLTVTFLRDSLYADFFVLMRSGEGVIRGPAGTGRVGAVAIDDVAAVAAWVLRSPAEHENATYELTGPAALSMSDVAATLTARGIPTTFEDEDVEQAYASRASYGAPDWEVEGWVTSYLAIRDGSLDRVTGDVERVLGRPPLSLTDVLSR